MALISIEQLIVLLKQKNIDLGKGDPYNRFRYYTKIGWLPHMTRKKNEDGVITGHYPLSVIETIEQIENLKKEGKNNLDITNIIKSKSKEIQTIKQTISNIKNLNINYILILIIVISVIGESIRLISLNEKKDLTINQPNINIIPEKKIVDSGIIFLPKGQNIIFVPSSSVTPTSIILLNIFNNLGFNNNYFIKEIKPNQGFYIQTTYQTPEEAKFNWVIIQ